MIVAAADWVGLLVAHAATASASIVVCLYGN